MTPVTPPPTITAFEHSPDEGWGMARDTRMRRAFEEAGQPCRVRPVPFARRAFFDAHAEATPG